MFALERVVEVVFAFRWTACLGATSSAQQPGKDPARELGTIVESAVLSQAVAVTERLARLPHCVEDDGLRATAVPPSSTSSASGSGTPVLSTVALGRVSGDRQEELASRASEVWPLVLPCANA